MSSVTHVLLFDLNLDENAQYILSTLKYHNIVSSIASVMMLPVPEIVFTDGFPPAKGRRCACVTINSWADTEAAYELVSELKKNGTSSIAHIGGLWSAKVIDDNALKVLLEMTGDFRWALECDHSVISTSSDADTDITDEYYEDMNDSDSEIARIFPEDSCWKTVSADGSPLMDVPMGWEYDAPSPIPEMPKLVRWKMNCTKDDCNLCVPLENNYNNLYVQVNKVSNE